jgi:hypothetical protein
MLPRRQSSHISTADLIKKFKSALPKERANVIKKMWDSNKRLRDWYSGQPVNFGNDQQSDWRVIQLDELYNDFRHVLVSRKTYIINAMWDNPVLSALYTGQSVNLGDDQQPDWHVISDNALIRNFEYSLSTQKSSVIKQMKWDNNQRLYNAIKSLDPDESKLLLKRVLSNQRGATDFIIRYLSWLDNISVIQCVIEDINRSCKNEHVKNTQIPILENRLKELTQYMLPSTMAFPWYNVSAPVSVLPAMTAPHLHPVRNVLSPIPVVHNVLVLPPSSMPQQVPCTMNVPALESEEQRPVKRQKVEHSVSRMGFFNNQHHNDDYINIDDLDCVPEEKLKPEDGQSDFDTDVYFSL